MYMQGFANIVLAICNHPNWMLQLCGLDLLLAAAGSGARALDFGPGALSGRLVRGWRHARGHFHLRSAGRNSQFDGKFGKAI